jgi:uncharacterized membrane protein YdjX (TVP38/TMEM64 family)
LKKIDWHHSIVRVAVAIVALVGVFCLFHFLLEPYMIEVDSYIEKIGVWGPVLFIVIFIVGTTLLFPEAILALAAGAIFGVWWGLLWMTIGGVLASFIMFFVGRHLLRSPVEKLLLKHPKLQSFNDAVSNFKIITLLRLSPFNYSALSYLASVSKLKFSNYAFASIAMIPGFLSTTYIGYAAKHAADLAKTYDATGKLPTGDSVVHEITVYGGLVVAVSVSIIVARVALRTIKNSNLSESPKSLNH